MPKFPPRAAVLLTAECQNHDRKTSCGHNMKSFGDHSLLPLRAGSSSSWMINPCLDAHKKDQNLRVGPENAVQGQMLKSGGVSSQMFWPSLSQWHKSFTFKQIFNMRGWGGGTWWRWKGRVVIQNWWPQAGCTVWFHVCCMFSSHREYVGVCSHRCVLLQQSVFLCPHAFCALSFILSSFPS